MPVDVLVRLLHDRPEPVAAGLGARAALPVTLQERMADHELWRVRCAVAGHERLEPMIRDMLLGDPDWRVRTWVLTRRKQQPPDEALFRLMADLVDPPDDVPFTTGELFEELFLADWRRVFVAARHPDPRVRRYAVAYGWRDDLRFLLSDPDPQVAVAAAASRAEHERLMKPADLPDRHCHAFWWVLQRPLSPVLAEQVAASGDLAAIQFVASNPTLPPTVVEILSHHPEAQVRAVVATRAGLTGAQVAALAADPDDAVRMAFATHAYVSDDDRAILDGNADLDLDQAVRWARTENPRLRRRAAQRPDLPAELVHVLAVDPDARVRADLALHHPGAPGALLLSCYLENRNRTELLTLPQFPRAGLSRFADHADPHVRLLATRDPDADPALIGHLTTDPDPCVRTVAARCSRLPADRLTALLTHPELAADAAANPSLDWKSVIEALR